MGGLSGLRTSRCGAGGGCRPARPHPPSCEGGKRLACLCSRSKHRVHATARAAAHSRSVCKRRLSAGQSPNPARRDVKSQGRQHSLVQPHGARVLHHFGKHVRVQHWPQDHVPGLAQLGCLQLWCTEGGQHAAGLSGERPLFMQPQRRAAQSPHVEWEWAVLRTRGELLFIFLFFEVDIAAWAARAGHSPSTGPSLSAEI